MESSLRSELEAFPNLAATVNEYANGFMTDALNPAEQMIRSLVDCHLSYINMSHPQFVGATEVGLALPASLPSPPSLATME